jgi:hypothetical protein
MIIKHSLVNDGNSPTIIIMAPSKISGGVKTIVTKLMKGLKLEGFSVRSVTYNLWTEFIQSLKLTKQLYGSAAIIYTSSIPVSGHLIHSEYSKSILFVHGYTKYQLLETLKHGKLSSKLGATYLMCLWKICETARKIHRFMCLCKTACEMNNIYENYILLPEFILPGEEKYYEKILKELKKDSNENKGSTRILTYTSFARSPRLLSAKHIEYLMKMISRQINRKVELIIIDPHVKAETVKLIGSITTRYVRPLPRMEFLRLLVNADLFIELNIDEELRDSTIEAALLGVPVAKLTHPLFRDRCDYKENDLIHAYSFKELADKIAEYIQNKESCHYMYSKTLRDFVLRFRTWDYVKRPLIEYLKEA